MKQGLWCRPCAGTEIGRMERREEKKCPYALLLVQSTSPLAWASTVHCGPGGVLVVSLSTRSVTRSQRQTLSRCPTPNNARSIPLRPFLRLFSIFYLDRSLLAPPTPIRLLLTSSHCAPRYGCLSSAQATSSAATRLTSCSQRGGYYHRDSHRSEGADWQLRRCS